MTVGAIAFPESRDLHLGDEAICRDFFVTPLREDSGTIAVAARRATDVKSLTFPLQVVLMIIGAVVATTLSVTGAFWITTSAMRSDVRDILTRMELQTRVDTLKDDAQKQRDVTLHEQINALGAQISAGERRQELLRLEFQQLREQVLFKAKVAK